MGTGKKIKKRVEHLNRLMDPDIISKPKSIHSFRLEVKRLQALMEARTGQHSADDKSLLPEKLDSIYHLLGKTRKFDLTKEATEKITEEKSIPAPTAFIHHLEEKKDKNTQKLKDSAGSREDLNPDDFIKSHENGKTPLTEYQFLISCSESILSLLRKDLMTDLDSLHQLRKILKSLLYTTSVFKETDSSLHRFLKNGRELMKSMESKIGTIHDLHFFLKQAGGKFQVADPAEQSALSEISKAWQDEIQVLSEDIKKLLPRIDKLAKTLRKKSQTTTTPSPSLLLSAG